VEFDMNAIQHLDFDALNGLKEIMEDDFTFLVETFIQDSGNRLADLQSLIQTPEADAVRRAAHSFKGSCSNMGALHLASLCSAIEHKALSGDFSDYTHSVEMIDEEFQLIKQMFLDFLA
jgi:HPt (histidine-containing phosphotransfer) domain-containing protein